MDDECLTSLRGFIGALQEMQTQQQKVLSSISSWFPHASRLSNTPKQATTPLAPSTATSPSAAAFDKLSTTESPLGTPTPEGKDVQPKSDAADEDKTLLVTESFQHTSVRRKLVPCYGTCPQDLPLELGTTYTLIDRRMLTPGTVRFRANVAGNLDSLRLPGLQDQITTGVLARVRAVLQAKGIGHKVLPGVIFDEDEVKEGELRLRPCLDLICDTAEVFKAVRDSLSTIAVEPVKGERVVYSQYRWSNSLPGYIFPIDILRLPNHLPRTLDFFKALEDMVVKVGEPLGVGLLRLEETQDERSFAGITRVYVKLSPAAIKLSLAEMVALLPTRLLWEGSGYTLRYTGCSLNEKRIDSKTYP